MLLGSSSVSLTWKIWKYHSLTCNRLNIHHCYLLAPSAKPGAYGDSVQKWNHYLITLSHERNGWQFAVEFVIHISLNFINPLRAKFFWGNINIYLHFMSFLHIDLTQVLKTLPQVREGPTYSIESISWLLMSRRRKEPGHQQPWYWPS